MRDLQRLGSFVDVIGRPAFVAGSWGRAGFDYSSDVMTFCQYCYDDQWVMPGFDWPAWKGTAEAERFRQPKVILESATADDLARLLTIAIRQDRFVEGGLAGWFEAGLIKAICSRARLLAA